VRRYEMMIILSDLLDEEAATALFERIKSILADQGGNLLDEAWWGKRKFAYEINKRTTAGTAYSTSRRPARPSNELERQLKIHDDVVRFKTVRPEVRVHRASA
jgi:small subunit ribosomal protein S6